MSALAALPAQPRVPRERHIEIVSTRRQKRARPRAVYALVTVGSLFAILAAQLLLSIVVSDGAYRISELQQQQRELARDQQSLTEELQVLESPQHLAANAESLGMVGNSGTAFLRLSDGKVLGAPAAAKATGGIRQGAKGGPLIANQLLTGVSLTAASSTQTSPQTSPAGSASTQVGAPGPAEADASLVSAPQGLPSPITR